MIPKECKRLAEVDFPIAVVSRHAAREKSIRHGHPSTLHLWWARRPLAACRAMLLGLLLPDPCDEHCPRDFKEKARELLPRVQGRMGARDEDLRRALLKFIGDFANWDLSSSQAYLEAARGLVKAAHGDEPSLVVDPFAGGGSIPLEALWLGCEAFASDLNPVACLILKVMLEDIPRHGPGLSEELRRVGAEVKKAAEKELAEFYPADPDGATPIAYLWARTVRCEAPNCGAEIPLIRALWLSRKRNRRVALRLHVDREPSSVAPRISAALFEPASESDVGRGTVSRSNATCLACGVTLPAERVREQISAQNGGADAVFDANGVRLGGAILLAVVTHAGGEKERRFRAAEPRDYAALNALRMRVSAARPVGNVDDLAEVASEPLPPIGTLGFRVQRYGMTRWRDLFSLRQRFVLATLASHVRELPEASSGPGSTDALRACLALTVTKQADYLSSICTWHYHNREKVNHTFARQALPFVTDFVETVFSGTGSGAWAGLLDWTAMAVENCESLALNGTVASVDACELPLMSNAADVWFTDPPYYDAIPYSDLSDFFFVWLKRILPRHPLLRDRFDSSNPLTPKAREAVQDETKQVGGRRKDRTFFEEAMGRAFAEGRRVLREEGVGSVVFAHKTTEGWEALLSGMIRGGWTITGSWPIATEMATRLRARESAALATSVHLVCRPRSEAAPIGDWGEVLRELPRRVGDWMERLQGEGIRGADLVFACIGPALEIFSRYSKVETAEGREIQLPEFLEKIWEVVGRAALEQVLGAGEAGARNGAAGALEEDARLTALFLWTLQGRNGEAAREDSADQDEDEEDEEEEGGPDKRQKGVSLIYDVVRRFAQPLGVRLPEWEGRIIDVHKGIVRLLPVAERAKQLFGDEGAQAVADQLERSTAPTAQLKLFPQGGEATPPAIKGRGRRKKEAAEVPDEALQARREATTLDRVHAAMLLQAGGRANALRPLLAAEQQRGPDFLRLANALSALYPKDSEEKRLLDAMLLAVPR